MRNRNIPSQKKKLSVAAGVMLIFLIIIGDFVAGFTGLAGRVQTKAENQTFRSGTFTFSTSSGQVVYGPFTVSFSPAFALPPLGITFGPLSTYTANIAGPTVSFLNIGSSAAVDGVWTGMPAAKTEIFGQSISTACCRALVTLAGLNSCQLVVGLVSASNTIGATLSVQWASNANGPWNDFAGSSVDIHTVAVNPRSSNTFSPTTGLASSVFLRIVGTGGGGAGDNPQFGSIQMACTTTVTGFTPSWSVATSTDFQLTVTLPIIAPTSGTSIVVGYTAYSCLNGLSVC